jgi:signal transduction histidine kinase
MRKVFLSMVFLFALQLCEAQTSWIDSARNSLASAKNDSIKFYWLTQIFFNYLYSTPDSCLHYMQQALALAKQMKSDISLSAAYGNFGLLYYTIGDYPQALSSWQESLKYAEKSGSFLTIQNSYDGLSLIYEDEGDFEHAIFYARKGEALLESHWKPSFASGAASNLPLNDTIGSYLISIHILGEIYEKVNIDSAFKYIQLFNDGYLKENHGKMDFAVIPYELGNVYSKKGDYSKAIQYYRTGIAISSNNSNSTDLIKNYYGIANTYKEVGDIDSSIFYAKKVIEVSRYGYNPIFKLNALNLLTSSYKSQKNIDSLAKYLELTTATKDSLFSQQKVMQVQNMTFNEQLRQQELAEQQRELQNKIKLYSLLAALAVFLIIAFLLYRNNRHKQKAYTLLQKQKRETEIQKTKTEQALEELKSTQAQLIQSEKMASLGELTAGIAHEIQNPLNFVNNFSEVSVELADELKDELNKINVPENEKENIENIINDLVQNQQKINQHGKRADAIVKGMLQHSRVSSGQKEPTDINALAHEYLRLSYHGLRAKDKTFNATMQTDFDKTIEKINIIPQDIGRVLLNLFNNAFYSVTQKKNRTAESYEPTVSVCTKKINEKIEIHIKDNGNGVPQKVLDKIFQPFFTTKPTGEGTGLGLSLSYDIIKAHGGDIKVITKEGEGAEFIIQLPIN